MTATAEVSQALQLLQAFASVGVQAFDLTLTNLEGQKLLHGYYGRRSLHQLRHTIAPLLRAATAYQHNVIVRPRPSPRAALLVQLDDLAEPEIRRLAPVSLVMLQTSPGNYQVWVAVEAPASDLARRLRQGTGADPCASQATRMSGSRNFKLKYAPHFPLVEIIACHLGQVVQPAELESLELVTPPEEGKLPLATLHAPPLPADRRKWPSYQRCVQYAPPARGGENRPDISKADFTWCLIAMDWGWSAAATAAKLMEQSRKAQENGEGYAFLTAQNAAAVVARRRGNHR
jgi:hypothetical protein